MVTERSENCVSIFSSSGVQSFGISGSCQGQFISPSGVTVDGVGNILVADSNNSRVQKFTHQLVLLEVTDIRGSIILVTSQPMISRCMWWILKKMIEYKF